MKMTPKVGWGCLATPAVTTPRPIPPSSLRTMFFHVLGGAGVQFLAPSPSSSAERPIPVISCVMSSRGGTGLSPAGHYHTHLRFRLRPCAHARFSRNPRPLHERASGNLHAQLACLHTCEGLVAAGGGCLVKLAIECPVHETSRSVFDKSGLVGEVGRIDLCKYLQEAPDIGEHGRGNGLTRV